MKKILLFIFTVLTSLTLIACDEVEDNVLKLAIDSVSISYAQGDSSLSVTQNVTLPTVSNFEGVTLSWTSSEPAVISNSGVVTRPVGGSNVSVMLIVTATFNGESEEKIFYLTVIPLPQGNEEEDVFYTVTFQSNGGSNVTAQSIKEGEFATQPSAPTRSGYTFGGWYSDSALTTQFNFGSTPVNSDITLYAKWNEIVPVFTVTFNTDGGSAVANQSVNQNGKVNKPQDPTKTGFEFVGWFKDSTLETPWNFDTDTISAATTLYAKWEKLPETFTVTFNANGGSAVANQSVLENKYAEEPEAPTRNGYTFVGWFIDLDTDVIFVFEEELITENITLYAKWQLTDPNAQIFAITFNSNGGNYNVVVDVVEGWPVLEPATPVKEAHTFLGWFIDAEFTTEWDFEDDVTSNMTLYAKWEVNPDELPKLPTPVNGIGHTPNIFHFGIGPYDQGGGIGFSGFIEILITNTETNQEYRELFAVTFNQGIAYTYGHLDLPAGMYTMTYKAVGNHTTHADSLYYPNPVTFEVFPKAVGKPELTLNGSMLSWAAVTNAAQYELWVGEEMIEDDVTSPFDLSTLDLEPGVYTIKILVIPVQGYVENSATIEFTVVDNSIQPLETPTNLAIIDDVFMWDAVEHATGYVVFVAGQSYATATNSFDLAPLNLNGTFEVTVVAKADGVFYLDSAVSAAFEYIGTSQVTPLIGFEASDLAGEGGGLVNTHGGGMFRNFVYHAPFAGKLTQDGNAEGIRIRVYALDGVTLLGEQDYPTIPANWNITAGGFAGLLQAGNIIHIQIRPSAQGIANGYTYSPALIYTLKA
ncbi:InlB B-repeat-containing protein [Acholeplasma equirhinis]|uniref:InlB B-repeat-containing protein n=1 Tax=Acholeplasma equirhinis TaxID=555393 RepID=UPI00197AACAA|nr:InlB B-repeat-containing protein [Acholeplasma equirhinis]MBN3489895.1 InlB B-repeat-containing protein [Acholeplasma equirhinis]